MCVREFKYQALVDRESGVKQGDVSSPTLVYVNDLAFQIQYKVQYMYKPISRRKVVFNLG